MEFADLGKRMQKFREAVLDLKQTELAEQLGTVQTLISRFERGLGGNIHLVLEFINYLEKRGYPGHMLFAKDFGVELIKQNANAVDENNNPKNPVEVQLAELKYFMQKGFEKAITLENLIAEVIPDAKSNSKKERNIAKKKK